MQEKSKEGIVEDLSLDEIVCEDQDIREEFLSKFRKAPKKEDTIRKSVRVDLGKDNKGTLEVFV